MFESGGSAGASAHGTATPAPPEQQLRGFCTRLAAALKDRCEHVAMVKPASWTCPVDRPSHLVHRHGSARVLQRDGAGIGTDCWHSSSVKRLDTPRRPSVTTQPVWFRPV